LHRWSAYYAFTNDFHRLVS